MRNNPQVPIVCDTLIMNSILDKKPKHIEAKRVVQMVHCIQQGNFQIPKGRDIIVNVSQASKDSFGESSKDGIAKTLNRRNVSVKLDRSKYRIK